MSRIATQMLLAALVTVAATPTFAAGCDLDEVIGYQVVSGPTIQGYIEAEKQYRGFEGCVPGRIIVFTDNTGVRCKSEGRQHLDLPRAYLFVRSRDELKLCVEDTFYDVAPMR